MPEVYIGDGVYASHDGYQIWLSTERDGFQHRIALESETLAGLFSYVEQRPWQPREVVEVKPDDVKQILTLADYVEQAKTIEFHSGDREPGTSLTDRGRKWIIAGLRLLSKSAIHPTP